MIINALELLQTDLTVNEFDEQVRLVSIKLQIGTCVSAMILHLTKFSQFATRMCITEQYAILLFILYFMLKFSCKMALYMV